MNFGLRIIPFFEFVLVFVGEVLLSNLRLIRDIAGNPEKLQPGVIELPLEPISDRQLWLLATCITMTPGTLSLGYVAERSALRIHCLHADEEAAIVDTIRTTFEERIRRVF